VAGIHLSDVPRLDYATELFREKQLRGAEEGLTPPRSGPVVVGVDGTPASDPALRLAGELAGALGAGLVAVHAWSDVQSSAGGLHRASESCTALADEAASGLDEQLERVASRLTGVPVERRLVDGTPVRALLEMAATARMVVVAQRDDGPAAGVHLGSTGRGLVEFAPCPVVVARGRTRP
jgi:nucleotide-binding universal stress UspA family protein